MKTYIIKKGSEVTGWMLDKDGVAHPEVTDIVNRDVTFSENWFDELQKCECCEDENYVFYHRNLFRLTTNKDNVVTSM